MLSETKLGAPLARPVLDELAAAGEVVDLRPGEALWAAGDPADGLVAVLDGDLDVEREPGDAPGWIGPGDLVGEIGFVLGTRRTRGLRARAEGARVWRLPRSALTTAATPERLALLARLLTALAPFVRVRHQKVRSERAPRDAAGGELCDHGHPAVVHLARFLGRPDPRDTAAAIWDFVRHVPYRIGFWDVRASEVLRLGFGMCTTKSTLQVALLRASGIESAFGEVVCRSDSMNALVPAAYRHFLTRKPRLKHYFAVVRLDGAWRPLDATFPPAVWRVLHPDLAALAPEADGRFHPLPELLRADPGAFEVHEDLRHVVGKRPFFDADSVEAMNIVLDRIQGSPLPTPGWVAHVHRLVADEPRAAFHQAYAALSADVERLRAALLEPAPRPPPGDAHEAVL